jgi:beta-1,4-N-acetylglucosaminyltransferase
MDSYRRQSTAPALSFDEPSFFSIPNLTGFTPFQKILLLGLAILFVIINLSFFRLASILSRESRKSTLHSHSATIPNRHQAHLLIVLGSGGHTAEMLNILSTSLTPHQAPSNFTCRTYVVSSGDSFSAQKAHEFESSFTNTTEKQSSSTYNVVTVHRARKVHQSLFTAPFSSLRCLWDCIQVLKGSHADFQSDVSARGYPDLILTNGPGTGVIVILASIILLFFGFGGNPSDNDAQAKSQGTFEAGQMRSIYIESWARVQTLSLSGRLLKPLVDRFIVQWPQLVKKEGQRVEYIGPLVT